MDIEIASERENPLLNRKEAVARISHPGKPTPLRKELLLGLGKALNAPEDLIIIRKILTSTGSPSCEARVLVYRKREDIPKETLEKLERRLAKKAPPAEAGEGAVAGATVGEKGQKAQEKKA